MGKSSFKGHYRCPNCKGKLSYNVEKEMWNCEYCDSVFAEAQLESENEKNRRMIGNFLGGFKSFFVVGSILPFAIIAVAIISIVSFVILGIKMNDKILNNDNNSYEVRNFNNVFEIYSGTELSFSVGKLLDNVVTNNKTNKDHIIIVVYGDISTNNPNDIINIKKSLVDWQEYEIILDYDDNGYIYMVTIE